MKTNVDIHMSAVGRYEDELVQRDGTWRIRNAAESSEPGGPSRPSGTRLRLGKLPLQVLHLGFELLNRVDQGDRAAPEST